MQQHPRQAQGLSQAADVLAAGAAVAAQHRIVDGVALLHRHPFDRLGHAGRGNGDGPLGHLFGAVGQAAGRLQLPRQCRQDVSGGLSIEGPVPLGAKDLGEKRGL